MTTRSKPSTPLSPSSIETPNSTEDEQRKMLSPGNTGDLSSANARIRNNDINEEKENFVFDEKLLKQNTVSFENLPYLNDELLTSYFDTVYHPGHVYDLTVSKCEKITSDGFINIYKLRNLSTLILDNLPNIKKSACEYFEDLHNLTKLKLSRCYGIDDDFIMRLSNTSIIKSLNKLKFIKLPFITTFSLGEQLLKNFDKMEKLSFESCTSLNNNLIMNLCKYASKMPNLYSLNLNHIKNITNTGIDLLLSSPLRQKLTTLKLININLSEKITLKMAETGGLLCNLDKIQISNHVDISAFLESKSSKNLITLEIFQNYLKKNDNFKLLKYHKSNDSSNHSKALLTDSITFLSLRGLTYLPLNFENLRVLTLYDINSVELLRSVFPNPSPLFFSLEILQLINIRNMNHNPEIQSIFRNFFDYCELKRLNVLRIIDCDCDGKYLSKIARASIAGLKTLVLKNLPNISSLGLKNLLLSRICSDLNVLKLKNLPIDDEVFTYFAYSTDMQNLKSLSIRNLYITEVAIEQILRSPILGNLEKLSFKSNSNVDDRTVQIIVDINKKSLQKLVIDLNNQITIDGLKKLQKLPYLFIKLEELILDNEFMEKYKFYSNDEWNELLPILNNILNNKPNINPLMKSLKFRDYMQQVQPTLVSNILNQSFTNKLSCLELSNFANFDNIEIIFEILLQSQTLPITLQYLTLDDLNLYGRAYTVFHNFLEKYTGIKELSIGRIKQFCDDDLIVIANHWKNLQKISLTSLQNLTFNGFKYFCNSSNAINIKKLTITNLQYLDDLWVEAIALSANFINLNTLKILSCNNLELALKYIFDNEKLINIRTIIIDSFITCYPGNLKAISNSKYKYLKKLLLKLDNLNEKIMFELADGESTNSKKLLLKCIFELRDNVYAIDDKTFKKLINNSNNLEPCCRLIAKFHTNRIGIESAIALFKKATDVEFNLDLYKFFQKWDSRINNEIFDLMVADPITRKFLLNNGLSQLKRITSKSYSILASSINTVNEMELFIEKNKDGLNDDSLEEIVNLPNKLFCQLPLQQISTFPRLSPKGKRWFLTTIHEDATFEKFLSLYGSNKEEIDACILEKAFESQIFSKTVEFNPSVFKSFTGNVIEKFFSSQYIHNIQKLEISGHLIDDQFVMALSQQTTLKSLKTIIVSKPANKRIDEFSNFLASNAFITIEEFILIECEIPALIFKILGSLSYMINLKKLEFIDCILESEDNLFLLVPSKALRDLQDLTIKNVQDRKNRLPQAFLLNLSYASFNLSKIKFGGSKKLRFNSNECFRQWIINDTNEKDKIKNSLLNLNELSLRNINLSDDTLNILPGWYIFGNITILKLKDLDNLTFSGFKTFINNPDLPNLKYFVIKHYKFDNNWAGELARASTLTSLNKLKIKEYAKDVDSAKGIISILSSKVFLYSFCFDFEFFLNHHSEHITDAILMHIAKSDLVHETLRSFSFKNSKLTTQGILNFIEKLMSLKHRFDIDTFFCDNINNPLLTPEIFEKAGGENVLKKSVNLSNSKSLSRKNPKSILVNLLEKDHMTSPHRKSLLTTTRDDEMIQLPTGKINFQTRLNKFLREYAPEIDDDVINILAKHSGLLLRYHIQIRLKSSIHDKITREGLNTLIQTFCTKFNADYDWVLVDPYWRNMLNVKSLKTIAEGEKSAFNYLDDLDFSQNNFITTNGYQHLINLNLKHFQHSHDLEHADPFLYKDSNDFMKNLVQDRFDSERVIRDDEVGEAILKIINKATFLRKICLNNKNFGDKFCQKLSLIIEEIGKGVRGNFLSQIELIDNPRITSKGRKYLYAALVGNDTITLLNTKCNPSLEYEFNTVLNYGLHYSIKQKYREYYDLYQNPPSALGDEDLEKKPKRKIGYYDHYCIPIVLYSIACFPFALMQCFEDKLMKSCFIKTIGHITDRILNVNRNNTHSLEVTKDKAQRERFQFNKNCIILNSRLNSAKLLLMFVFNYILYNVVCFIFPIIFSIDCQNGHSIIGYVLYGIYSVIIFACEAYFFYSIQKTVNLGPVKYSPLDLIPLIISQLNRFDMYTDVLFVTSCYTCGYMSFAIASGIIVCLNVFFSFWQTFALIGTIAWKYFIKSIETPTNTTFINAYAKLAYIMELHSIATCLERYSSSVTGRLMGVVLPQMIITTLFKLLMEDVPQSITQILLTVTVKAENQILVAVSIISTIITLFISINSALKARPSVCDSVMLADLARQIDQRIEDTELVRKKLENMKLDIIKIAPASNGLTRVTTMRFTRIAARKPSTVGKNLSYSSTKDLTSKASLISIANKDFQTIKKKGHL